MWRENRVWHHYLNDIIAADANAADFLTSYLTYTRLSKEYIKALAVVDLQRYKIITHPPKVRMTMRERLHLPFVFVVSKN